EADEDAARSDQRAPARLPVGHDGARPVRDPHLRPLVPDARRSARRRARARARGDGAAARRPRGRGSVARRERTMRAMLAILLAAAGAGAGDPPRDGFAAKFTDVTDASGVRFTNHGGSGRLLILDTMGSGLAVADFDGDGDDDVYLLTGSQLDPYEPG